MSIHFYTLAEAAVMFPTFVKSLSTHRIKGMWKELLGTPSLMRMFGVKKGRAKRRFDFRKSEVRDSTRTWTGGVNYARRKNNLAKLTVGVITCLNPSCDYKQMAMGNKKNQRFFCCNCKLRNELKTGENVSVPEQKLSESLFQSYVKQSNYMETYLAEQIANKKRIGC